MSSATDEQRRLLDELRKLACDINEKEIRSHSVITLNQGRYNRQFRLDMNHDWLNAWHAELERILQAIEATLGPRTCHPVPIYGFDGEFTEYDYDECSECGEEWEGDTPNFCPNCGARVVDPTTNDAGTEVSERMSYKTSLELAYHMGYDDALARKMPDTDKVAVLLPDVADGAGEYIYGTDGHEGHWLTGEEIVRCRDCERYEWREHLGRSYCHGEYPTEPDGFCAWGERRDA